MDKREGLIKFATTDQFDDQGKLTKRISTYVYYDQKGKTAGKVKIDNLGYVETNITHLRVEELADLSSSVGAEICAMNKILKREIGNGSQEKNQ